MAFPSQDLPLSEVVVYVCCTSSLVPMGLLSLWGSLRCLLRHVISGLVYTALFSVWFQPRIVLLYIVRSVFSWKKCFTGRANWFTWKILTKVCTGTHILDCKQAEKGAV